MTYLQILVTTPPQFHKSVGTILSDIPLLSQYRKIPSRIQRRGRIQRSVKWKYCAFHFVEVQLACIIIFKMAWNFWLLLIHLLMRNSQLFFYTYYFQILWHGISWKLTLRIPLQKWGHKMASRDGHVTFPGNSCNVCNFLAEMSTFKLVIKLTVRQNKFGKILVQSLQTRIYF